MSGLIASLVMGFSGLSRVLVSTLARNSDLATGIAFIIWLGRLLFMDMILLGVLIRQGMSSETVIALALFNPMQVFRLQIELRRVLFD